MRRPQRTRGHERITLIRRPHGAPRAKPDSVEFERFVKFCRDQSKMGYGGGVRMRGPKKWGLRSAENANSELNLDFLVENKGVQLPGTRLTPIRDFDPTPLP